jgi:membrane protein
MANIVSWTIDRLKRLNDLIWHTPLSEISRSKTFLLKQLRIILLAAKGFTNDKVNLRASALTFYSLLSVIPIVAIAFAISKLFGLDQQIQDLISRNFKSEQSEREVINWLLQNTKTLIENARGDYMALIGMLILFWSGMSLLNHIETSFNHIWQVRQSRPWMRKFTDYLTIILVGPVFIVLSSSLPVVINKYLPGYISDAPILDFFKPVVSFLIKFIPYGLTWVTLTILFIIMPNAKVKFVPAMISGIIAGSLLQGLQWLYIDLQYGITKLNYIYGSFAAIPLFIIWIQSSWIVVLLGAEIAFANQNISRYEMESEALHISNYQKRALVLMIMHMIIRNFMLGEKPISAEYIAANLKIPVRLARDILQDLFTANLVTIIHENEEKERLYQPAMDVNRLTVSFVFSRLDKKGIEQIMVIRNKNYEKIITILEKFERLAAKSDSNILIKDL